MTALPPFLLTPDSPPSAGVSKEVRPGLFWVQLDLPFPPGHVNCWLLADGSGWTAIDAGLNGEETVKQWQSVLIGAGNPDVARLIVTHGHADHAKAAGWFCRMSGARMAMPQTEWFLCRAMQKGSDDDGWTDFARRCGMPEETVQASAQRRVEFCADFADFPLRFDALADGDRLSVGGRDWDVLTGGGHSVDMAALYCASDRILIGADHILPRIVPILQSFPFRRNDDAVARQLAMFDRLEGLAGDTLVLPSHGEPFTGLHRRLEELRGLLAAKIDRIAAAVTEPMTAWQVLLATSRLPPLPMRATLIAADVVALLDHLVETGRIRAEQGGADTAPVIYRPA